MEIRRIFEDKEMLVVDKPTGISVHNNEDPQNLLILLKNLGPLFPVHRLDKETSGVQVFARNEQTAKVLAEEFQGRTVQKIYRGILRGKLKTPQGTWNHSLSDKAEGRKNPAGNAKDRVQCLTHFKTLETSAYFTFCEFDLKTGRQHQIRKHAALANHALIGDPRYGDSNYNKKNFERYGSDRMFLHCFQLTLLKQTLESPVPAEFKSLLDKSQN